MIGLQIGDHCHGQSSWNTKLVDDIVFDEINHVMFLTSVSGMTSTHFEK